ncbi:hypothetical protein BM536_034560 [Streptomyces phaeoluteigriseus]|jgi:hypothetical protein|uniref:Uncharacterized protein n=1 Tax=Streptomyces phaeoluteigriseus TaxID=114686 RepID=A0A1V6MIN6_9ACTN|nr:hypothetical protein [Streptomyces phaeoluteigriseus]OQD52152.1 hypothetical protein BM536_034560 [Streptomyces phaeoluteigriseus]
MSFPEGWEWLGEGPAWDPPAELRQPTQVWVHNLVVSMLSSEFLGNASVSLVGEVLTQYSEFNAWVATEGKRTLDARELLARAGALDTLTARAYEAWTAFRTRYEAEGRKVGAAEEERLALNATLRSIAAELEALRRPDERGMAG